MKESTSDKDAKIQTLITYTEIDEIFGIGKYKEKIKFDKIWGYHNPGSPSNKDAKLQTF